MTVFKRIVYLFLTALLFLLYKNSNALPVLKKRIPIDKKNYTMGTTYSYKNLCVDIWNQKRHRYSSITSLAIKKMLICINSSMSTYLFVSSISMFNRALETNSLILSNFAFVISKSIEKEYHLFFFINLNRLLNIWQFTNKKKTFCLPKIQSINKTLRSNCCNTSLPSGTCSQNKYLSFLNITLSGSAKGYGVDSISKMNQYLGYSNFMIEIGGEIKVSGKNAEYTWIVGMPEPTRENLSQQLTSIMHMYNAALASSGQHLNNINYKNHEFTHVLNTCSGVPIKTNLLSVNITSHACILSDIDATVLFFFNSRYYDRIFYKTSGRIIMIYYVYYEKYWAIKYNHKFHQFYHIS